ncbi:hypothetical protein [Streptomyces nodosus]|uniref:hypothetical protein n=1 Tax=Streptomyces nodosus TaxID=40318 RepID=UPI0037F5ECAD
MDLEKTPPRQPGEGCLTVAIRLPVRIVVLVLVVPVRLLWDALVVGGRVLRDSVLRPVGRALGLLARAVFVWPWVMMWRYVLVPLGRGIAWLGHVLIVVPALWIHRRVLTPLGRGVLRVLRATGAGCAWVHARVLTPVGHAVVRLLRGVGYVLVVLGAGAYAVVAWLGRWLLVVPAGWLYRRVLTPLGHGVVRVLRGIGAGCAWLYRTVLTPLGHGLVRLAGGVAWLVGMAVTGIGVALYWTLRVLLVVPALAVGRWILAPVGRFLLVVGREIGTAIVHAWRVAGHISLVVGRFLAAVFRRIFVEPVRRAYRTVLTPVGHVLRDTVLRPAAEIARGVGRATRQALAGAREAARQARADIRRMLFGEPREPRAVSRREPQAGETRTLGTSTTALTKD